LLIVDRKLIPGGNNNDNTVMEAGETVPAWPVWQNLSDVDVSATSVASSFTGPPGATYTIVDSSGDYGTIPPDILRVCGVVPFGDCYVLSTSLTEARPKTHWDAQFTERLSTLDVKVWKVHIGRSFADVEPPTPPATSAPSLPAPHAPSAANPFYARIETLFHNGITSGCSSTEYCPEQVVTRDQMSIFIGKALAGGGPNIAASGTANGKPYNCAAGDASIWTDVAPTDIFCKHAHYLAVQNVTLGCSATQFCPQASVSRSGMAGFIARAAVAPGGGPAVPETYGPDAVTNRSYSCSAVNPSLHFTDVPVTDPFCKHIHFLWARGFIDGCGADTYCGAADVTRDAMAKFIVNAFGLELYGP
jgi:hypothetical protein